MVVGKAVDVMGGIFLLIVSAIVLVILGLIFFTVNLWIISAAMGLLGLKATGDWIVLSAAILSAASMLGARKC